jgi:hypothetical protein
MEAVGCLQLNRGTKPEEDPIGYRLRISSSGVLLAELTSIITSEIPIRP